MRIITSQTSHLGGRRNLNRGRFKLNTGSAKARPLAVECELRIERVQVF